MRSRNSAFACVLTDNLVATWAPRTRPKPLIYDPDTTWTGLKVLPTVAGGTLDNTGIVEFSASFDDRTGHGTHHEVSSFHRISGRWSYVEPQPSVHIA